MLQKMTVIPDIQYTEKRSVRKRKRSDQSLKERNENRILAKIANHKLVQEQCRFTKNCINVIGAQRRSKIHSEIWKLSAIEQQQFHFSTIKIFQKRTVEATSRKKITVIYYLRDSGDQTIWYRRNFCWVHQATPFTTTELLEAQ